MRGWFDCLEGQYKNRVGKSRKENQSICVKIGNIAFKFKRGAPRLFDCGHRTATHVSSKGNNYCSFIFFL
jgi:hypothetical protein